MSGAFFFANAIASGPFVTMYVNVCAISISGEYIADRLTKCLSHSDKTASSFFCALPDRLPRVPS